MPGPYSDISVLIAEDTPQMAEAISQLVENRLGCRVVVCENGDDALQLLAERPFDLFITDMIMPGCHGLELIGRARDARPWCNIMVMTAYPAEFPYVDVINAGAVDFIIKPHSGEEMTAKLLRILRERELHEVVEREKLQLIASMEEMRMARRAQALAEAKYALLFEMGMNGMFVVDRETRSIEDVNTAFCDLSGRPREALIGVPFSDLLNDRDRERLWLALQALEEPGRGTLADIAIERPDGETLWLDVSVTFIRDEDTDMVLFACKDATEQRQLQDQLVQLASTDQLTGLYNQRAFQGRLAGAVATSQHSGQQLTLVSFDLDNFKQCNDTHGHPVGDEVLRRAGGVILSCIRSGDEGFRCGGDEFAVILRGGDARAGEATARRIRDRFKEGECHGVSMSFGVAQLAPGMDTPALAKTADNALYAAKARGKDTICVA
jgi:two-component system, cell cycle response regulator